MRVKFLNASSLRVWEVKAWRMARRKKWCCIAGCGSSRSQQLANNKVQDDTVDNHLLGYTALFTNSRNQDIQRSFFGFSVMQNFPKPANCWRIAHGETDGCTLYAKKLVLCDITWMWSSNVHNHILDHFFCTCQRVVELNELKECKQKIIYFFLRDMKIPLYLLVWVA